MQDMLLLEQKKTKPFRYLCPHRVYFSLGLLCVFYFNRIFFIRSDENRCALIGRLTNGYVHRRKPNNSKMICTYISLNSHDLQT